MTNEKSARDWTIFMNINNEQFSDVERMTAIEHIAYAPTHNSITKAMMLDVIRYLLTAQQPRVLTLEEVRLQTWDYCYIEAEVKPHSKTLETLCGTHRLYCTTSIVLERQTRGDEEYGKTWRCWTARPTDEQRKATPWDEPPKEET